ncbi:MAG: hypothetical protein D8M58_11825 [Calditrichaeota bacterium]|nr:MAG: hypothetical protein DWQ03_12610 [Calditrichota bacterium]MBL1206084.1 hypothetical protein [Calditrichota bacterium]NOG45910.1 hypothetical protein [Calditrichota bacterium]
MHKIIFVLSFLLIFACTESGKQKENSGDTGKSETADSFNPPDAKLEFLEKLYDIQMDIIQNPSSRAHKEKYIYNAYFDENNTLISFGNARLTNPQSGEKIATPLLKRAAIVDAKRWATYGLLWLNNDFEPDFGKISEVHQGLTKELGSFNKGDSLVVALATKVR